MPREPDQVTALRLEQAALRVGQAELRAEQLQLKAEQLQHELDRVRQFALHERRLELFRLLRRLGDGLWWLMVIGSTYFPLRGVEPLAHQFAGRNTQLRAGLTISFAFAAVTGVGWLSTGIQSRLRKQKIRNQRRRLADLESELAAGNRDSREVSSSTARGDV
ncbi:hypothetical protein ACFFWC_25950 [Plantactinospora siamensis]|uniref:Uncharacterized protein n=1 Tax=Plantactinospora siamensis TaxID=555372 RepID=A0ABV6P619_9ACTN